MWKTVKLGDVLNIQNGYAFDSTQFDESGAIGLIRIRDLKNGKHTQTRYSGSYESKYVVRSGDLLIGMDGEFRCYEWKGEDALLNQRVCRLQDFHDSVEKRFILYVIDDELKKVEEVTGFTTVKHLSSKILKELPIPLPPLAEQKRIVERLDKAFGEIDEAIATAEAKEETIYALKTSLLSLWLARDNWEKVRLGNICTLRNGRAYKKQELLSRGKYPVLRVGNFFTSNHWYYSDLELDETKYCDTGDLLYAWSASFGPRIWKSGKVIYHYHIWRIDVDKRKADKKFLYYWLEYDKELVKSQSGTGSTMTHVSKTSMEERVLSLPSLNEQREIVNKLDFAFSGIESAHHWLEACINNYSALKAAILKQELTPGEAV